MPRSARSGYTLAELLVATREEQLMGRVRDRASAERFARAWQADHVDAA